MSRTSGRSQRQPEGTLELVEDEAVILVKAAPRSSTTFGETVCCAGIDQQGRWVRLYPVSFRLMNDAQRFKRWDRVKYRWSNPKASKDVRSESRRVDPNSIEIVGQVKQSDRNPLAARCAVTSLDRELNAGRSLALLKAEVLDFWYKQKSAGEIRTQQEILKRLRDQPDLLALNAAVIPARSCPYSFHYRFRDEDKEREGTCQDWETEQTYFARLRDQPSEKAALEWMVEKFGREYPEKGMALAMGTHRYRREQWLINGVIRLNDDPQLSML